MNKKSILWILLDSIFVIVFNVIFFFIIGPDHNGTAWVSYAFIMLAYILLVFTPVMIHQSESKAIFGFSLYSVGAFYFLVELIVGTVFILVSDVPFKVALLVHIILFAIYAVILISNIIANAKTAEVEVTRKQDLQYVKEASTRLRGIMDGISDKRLKKQVEKAYDIIYASPTGTNMQAKDTEYQILQMIRQTETAVSVQDNNQIADLSERIINLANERNRLIALNR